MQTSDAGELIYCTGCDHPIRQGQPRLSDVPENIPEGVGLQAFRHFHLNCLQCPANATCYQRYAARQTPFVAQSSTSCAGCDDPIPVGESVLRDTFWVWAMPENEEENSETAGSFVGFGQSFKNAGRPLAFEDLSFRLRNKFFSAGLGNGRGIRTPSQAQEFYMNSVPRSVRSMGPRAIRDYLRGKDASHIESVANAPGKAKISGNVVWENHGRNVRRGAANMNFKDKMFARGLNRMNAIKGVGKTALGNAGRASMMAALVEIPVSAAEGAIRVVKGKKSREEASKDAALNTAKAGVAAGVTAAGFTVIAAFGASSAIGVVTPILVPLGIGMYGIDAYRRIREAAKDDEPLQRMALYFHASCPECGDGASCFESFATEVSEYSQ